MPETSLSLEQQLDQIMDRTRTLSNNNTVLMSGILAIYDELKKMPNEYSKPIKDILQSVQSNLK